MSVHRLMFTLFWSGLLGVLVSVLLCNITVPIAKSKYKKITKIVTVIVAFTLANLFRMRIQDCYSCDNATVKYINNITYSGEDILINDKKVKIDCVYSNKNMPRDILVNCDKLKNSFIPGIFNGSKKANILIMHDAAAENVYNYSVQHNIPCIEDNYIFFEATKFGLENSTHMWYEDSKETNDVADIKDMEVYDVLMEQSEQLEMLKKASLETDKKLEELKSEISNINSKSNEKHTSIVLLVVAIILVIWFIGILTYIIVVRVNTRIKQDLINTSSEAKIREGVMLDK